MKHLRAVSVVVLIAFVAWRSGAGPFASGSSSNGSQSLTVLDTPYVQDFGSLANTGASNALPVGWAIDETGTATAANGSYTAGTGSLNTGDVYSFGLAASSERALGTLLSGTNTPTVGVSFTNNTGGTITSLDVSYTGEQWRLGQSGRGSDRLDFQYSATATTLTTGTFIDADGLDFVGPINTGTVGALDGNQAANRTSFTQTITGLNIAAGATFWIRWNDFNVTGSDDGLAIDDFSLTPHGTVAGPSIPSGVGSATPSSVLPGQTAVLTVTVTPGANPPSTGIVVTGDLSGLGGSAAQLFADDGTGTTFTFNAVPDPATTSFGSVLLPITISDAQARSSGTSITLSVQPAIHSIQSSGTVSPLLGQTVTTEGIVTGVKFNGFFIQAPDTEADADVNTSEGIFVFTSSTPPAPAVVGNRVSVAGRVAEFKGTTSDPDGLSLTELVSPAVTLLSIGHPLPAVVTLTSFDLNPAASVFQLEKYESMRVHVDSVVSTSPTGGSVQESSATSISSGLFFGVLPGTARPFRQEGIQTPLPVPSEAPAGSTPPVFDANPEKIGVDTFSVFLNPATAAIFPPPPGATLEVTTGVTVNNITGPLDYAFRAYIVDAEGWNMPTAATPNAVLVPVSDRQDSEFTVATFNMERFFDTINDPGTSDVVLTAEAFDGRLQKASLAIRNVLKMPDIIGVEEMENLTTLQALADRVNGDAQTAGQGNPDYRAFLSEGNDIGGIDSGFLVRADRVDMTPGHYSVTQYGLDTTFADPGGNPTAILNDRPPLVLRANVLNAPFEPYAVTVIVNHLRSLSGVDGADGLRIRTKRRIQAEYLALLIRSFQNAGERVVSVGDYNAFEVNDGYVDVVGIVRGAPAPADQVTQTTTLSPSQLPNPALVDLVSLAAAFDRYSFVFDGNAQELDHILITTDLRVNRINYARMDADFPDSYRPDFTRPERVSDHDPIVAYFNLPDIDTAAPILSLPGDISMEGNTLGGAHVSFLATATDVADGVVIPVCSAESGSLFAVGTATVSCTATDAHGNSSGGSFHVTVTDTRPPVVTRPASLTAEATSGAGAKVSYSVSAADIVDGAPPVVCTPPSATKFPIGTTTVHCTATDRSGNVGTGDFNVTVRDTTRPVVHFVLAVPPILFPVNGKMDRVAVLALATDAVSTPSCRITAVAANDGATSADWQITGPLTANLRAARGRRGIRTYTLTVRCSDAAGNTSSNATAYVFVP